MDQSGNQVSVFNAIRSLLARWVANLITTVFRPPVASTSSTSTLERARIGPSNQMGEKPDAAALTVRTEPVEVPSFRFGEQVKNSPSTSSGRAQCFKLRRREQHCVVGKGLELKRIAAGVEKEHRRLLTREPLEADIGLDAKGYARRPDAFGQCLPLRHRQHHAEMRHGHIMPIDRIGRRNRAGIGVEVRHDLVAVEIKVDPMFRTTALTAAKHAPVERAGGLKIMDGKGKVKRTHASFLMAAPAQTMIEFAARPL